MTEEQKARAKTLERKLRGPCEELEDILEQEGAIATVIIQPLNVMKDEDGDDSFVHFIRNLNHDLVSMPEDFVKDVAKNKGDNSLSELTAKHDVFVPSHLMMLLKLVTGNTRVPIMPLLEKAHELRMEQTRKTVASITKLIEHLTSEDEEENREGWEPVERDGKFVGFRNPETGEEDLMN